MIVLYINGEHCTSLAQLKGYFHENPTPGSEVYADLLDYGRYGDIAQWLREVVNEPKLSSKVASISTDLTDSAFYAQLKAVITDDGSCSIPIKPTFDQCFSLEDLKCEVNGVEAKVRVSLKVLMCVNEEYELRISCNWGMRAIMVNPYNHQEGKSASFDFNFHKRPGKDIGGIMVLADGKELSRLSSPYRDGDEFIVGDVRFRMIHIDGGSYKMGTDYRVTLSNYSIGETQVTNALWGAVMGKVPFKWESQKPVEKISWNDCQTFIEKLNKMTGCKFRLPTEAEWEFAARGGTKSKGYQFSGSNDLNEVGWYLDNSGRSTHPVKKKKPNELGIYDMSGNVWEWCLDWYGDYKKGSWTNPTGPDSGFTRVFRGSCFRLVKSLCYLTHRQCGSPDARSEEVGLRLALPE